MRVVVCLAGEVPDGDLLRARVSGAELVIAADGGATRLLTLGLRPNVVIGDFDSLPPERLAALRAEGVEVVEHPAPQERTDGQVALELAAARGASEVILLGVGGGERLDHSLTNALFLVAEEFAALPIVAVQGATEAVGLFGRASGHGRETVRFEGAAGDYVSLIAVGPVRGVTTLGLRWELVEEDLSSGLPGAMSNELLGASGGFRVESGRAIATHSFRQRDAAPDAPRA